MPIFVLFDDVNVAWSNFVEIFLSALDIFVPKIKIKDPTCTKQTKNRPGGWLTNLI